MPLLNVVKRLLCVKSESHLIVKHRYETWQGRITRGKGVGGLWGEESPLPPPDSGRSINIILTMGDRLYTQHTKVEKL